MKESEARSQAAAIFEKAAEYIRQYGWQKEGMGEHGGPRCSMGVLASAYGAIEWDQGLATLMYTNLYKELDGISLTMFNAQLRDGEKVAQLYEWVAQKLTHSSRIQASV